MNNSTDGLGCSIRNLDDAPAPPEAEPQVINVAGGQMGSPWALRRERSRSVGFCEDYSPSRPRTRSDSLNHAPSLPPPPICLRPPPSPERVIRRGSWFRDTSRPKLITDSSKRSVGFPDKRSAGFNDSKRDLESDRIMFRLTRALPEAPLESHRCDDGYDPKFSDQARVEHQSLPDDQEVCSSSDQNQDSDEEDYDSDDDDTAATMAIEERSLWGLRIPRWCPKIPRVSRIASYVVTRAPCFWCIGGRHLTDRAILGRLNLLCAFFSAGQLASMLWLTIVMLAPNLASRQLNNERSINPEDNPDSNQAENSEIKALANIWSINSSVFAQGVLGFVVLIAAILATRVIASVDLLGAIRFLWTLLLLIPLAIFCVIGLFDYFRVTNVWIKHWWRDSTMAWFRDRFCMPQNTSDTLCTVPISNNESEWCLFYYNATNCADIRNSAQATMEKYMLSYYYINAGWGLCLILLLLLAVDTLENIISKPLVQRTRQGNFAASLLLPTFCSVAAGFVFSFAESSVFSASWDSKASWLGPLYISVGGLFLVGALLAWYMSASSILSTADKRKKLCAVLALIVVMSILVLLIATLFVASIAFSASLVKDTINNQIRGGVACALDQVGSCTRCDKQFNRCPEWSASDVTKVLQTQAKGSAAVSAIFILYAVAGLKIGFGMKKHILKYQIAYV